jgi:hypothetical protein
MQLETQIRQTYDRLKTLNLDPIDARLVGKSGDRGYVFGLKNETLKFLSIALANEHAVAPSKKIDEYWHEMVLNTPLYENFSKSTGRFVHHIPSDKPETEAYERTLEIYKKTFGNPDRRYWVAKAGDCSSNCSAGACNGSCGSFCSDGACQASCRG